MRKWAMVILFVAMLKATVYGQDYMVQLKESYILPRSSAVELDEVVPELNIYLTDKEGAYSLYYLGMAECIEEDTPLVAYDISYNDTYYTQQTYLNTMGITDLKNTEGITGDVRIAIIDTGVNTNHPEFEGTKIEQGYNYVKKSNDTMDYDNHGTMAFGIIGAQENNGRGIVGIAPNATFVPLVALSGGIGTNSTVISAISDAVDKYNCKVINISLGTEGKSSLVELAVNDAVSKGAIIVASAGNDGAKADKLGVYNYPAGFDNVISVGSVDKDFNLVSSSQKNDGIMVAGVGSGLYLTNSGGGISYGGGTSFSSPEIAGIIALIASKYPDITYIDAMNMIKAATCDTGASGKDYMGYGVLFADECLKYIEDKNDVYISPVREQSDGSYNIKLQSDNLKEADMVIARYSGNKLTDYSIQDITFDSNVYCGNIAKKNSSNEVIKIFAIESMDSMKSLSLTREIN